MPAYKKKKVPVAPMHSVVQIKLPPQPELEGTLSQKIKKFLKVLKSNYEVFQQYNPLTIGINKSLHPLYPAISRRIINASIHRHTQQIAYLQNVKKESHRCNLHGTQIELISDEAKQQARSLLKQLDLAKKKPKKKFS